MHNGMYNFKIHFFFNMSYGFNVTCFTSYIRSHHLAENTPKKNYYINLVMLFHIIHTYIVEISTDM